MSRKTKRPRARRKAKSRSRATPSSPGTTGPAPTRKRRLWLSGLLAIVVGAIVWQSSGVFRATPKPIAPQAPEQLDPDVRSLIERTVKEAREEPGDADRHASLAMVYEANSLWTEARASYTNALAIEPGRTVWRFHRAVVTQEAGDLQDALEQYRAISIDESSFAPASERLGWALVESGRIEAARTAFETVREAAPNAAAGDVGVGAVLRLSGDLEGAAASLARALELEPRHRTAHYLMGLNLRELGRAEEARTHLARGLAAEVRFLPSPLTAEIQKYSVGLAAVVARAELLRQRGDFAGAAALFERALVTHPGNLTLLNNLATSYLSQGETSRARALLDQAQSIGGDKTETLYNLAGWALVAGKLEDAVRFADRAIEYNPRLARLHAIRGQALVQLEQYSAATASMEEALSLEVRDPALYLGLAVLYEVAARWGDAREVYERALSIWPEFGPALAGLSLAALETGDRSAAAEALTELGKVSPNDPRLPELAARLGRQP